MSAPKTEIVGPAPHLAVDHAGQGPFVLFMHGIGGNRSNWRDQLAAFSTRYHVAAWDARGWGESDDYEGPLDFAHVAADMARVLDHFSKHRAHLVGLSMGGFFALEFYARHPERVLSLTLVDTLAGFAEILSPEARADFVRTRKAPLEAGKTPRDIAGPVAAALKGRRATPETVRRLEESIAALHKESYMKAVDSVVAFDRRDVLPRIAVPTLLVVGSDDTLTSPAAMRRMAREIADARFEEIEGAGHVSNLEAPQEFNRLVMGFLDSVAS